MWKVRISVLDCSCLFVRSEVRSSIQLLDDDDVEAFNGRIRWVEAKEWFTARLFDLRSFVGCLLEGHFLRRQAGYPSASLFLAVSLSSLIAGTHCWTSNEDLFGTVWPLFLRKIEAFMFESSGVSSRLVARSFVHSFVRPRRWFAVQECRGIVTDECRIIRH
jgi:hypothetical protein